MQDVSRAETATAEEYWRVTCYAYPETPVEATLELEWPEGRKPHQGAPRVTVVDTADGVACARGELRGKLLRLPPFRGDVAVRIGFGREEEPLLPAELPLRGRLERLMRGAGREATGPGTT